MNDISGSSAYNLNALDRMTGKAPDIGYILHDIDEPGAALELQSLIASGDYFELLATNLDHISQSMPQDTAAATELQRIVGQLLHIQRNYRIVAK